MLSPIQNEADKKSNWKFIAIIIGLFVVIGFIFGEPVFGVYQHASRGKMFVAEAQIKMKSGDLKDASLQLSLAHQEFLIAFDKIQRLAWYKNIPLVGNQINALDGLLQSAIELTGGLSDLANVADTILTPIQGPISKSTGQEKGESLKALSNSTALLRETRDKLNKAQNDLEGISTRGLLPQIGSALGLMKEKVPELQDAVDNLIIASQILPQALGYPQDKTYLFLFQNNMELRPAGGFIGTYGVLKLKNGEITSFFTDDVYNLDKTYQSKIETPKPFQTYNKRMEWYFRDSNWAPDFPTSAEKAQWFYHTEGGTEEFDGVIAITPTFIEKILALTGPITIPGYPYEFNADNFSDELEFHVEQNFYKFEDKTERKSIIGEFGEILLSHALSLPKDKLIVLFNVVSEGFKEKQGLIYFNDQNLEKVAGDLNWDGRVIETKNDYFWYIDCNLASLKSDPYVKRSINYEVAWDGQGNPIARLTMTYNHIGEFNWRSTRYRTYARLYVPKGSVLIKATGAESEIDQYDELNKTVFGFFKVTEPKTTETVTLEYKLPLSLTQSPYTLYAQKQAGTFNYPLDIKINWNGIQKEIKTDLTTDREIRIN